MTKPAIRTASALALAALAAACVETRPLRGAPDASPAPYARETPVLGIDDLDASPPAGHVRLKLHVDGMACPVRCAREVREMLSSVRGLARVAIDVPTQMVVVDVPADVDPQTVVDAVRAPYRATLL
jgi:copper chaperone CopZ